MILGDSQQGSDLDLSVYTDSNYAEKADDRRSASGVVVTLGTATVGWISSTQSIVTLSTTEAEYVALGDGLCEKNFFNSVSERYVLSLGGRKRYDPLRATNPANSCVTESNHYPCLLYTSPSPRD